MSEKLRFLNGISVGLICRFTCRSISSTSARLDVTFPARALPSCWREEWGGGVGGERGAGRRGGGGGGDLEVIGVSRVLLRSIETRDVAVGVFNGGGAVLHSLAERFLGQHELHLNKRVVCIHTHTQDVTHHVYDIRSGGPLRTLNMKQVSGIY